MRTHRSPFALTRLVVAGACLGVAMAAVAAPAVATPAVATPSFSKDITRAAPAVPPFKTRVLVENLEHPWSIAWLPNGEMLVTERGGALRRISRDFKLDPRPIEGLPTNIAVGGQGGLFDVIVHPDFGRNGLVFIAYAEGELSGRMASSGTAVARARLDGQRLTDISVLFRMQPKSRGGRHFGGRLAFDQGGSLYLTLGDRGDEDRAQRPNDHAGTVIRIPHHGEGRPDVFSRGHRNIQGAAIHPQTGQLWTHEHGPQGGDEINVVRGGRNHGWPTITYGVNYVTGTKIGEGARKAGLEQPVNVWVPSIAPSGMAFYRGAAFPSWQNSLLVGALRAQSLSRLTLEGDRVVSEERLLVGEVGRIRDVRVGPDGLVYLLTDESAGRLIRLEPR